jgi:hypothetical protein
MIGGSMTEFVFKNLEIFKKEKLEQIKLLLGRGIFISKEIKEGNSINLILGFTLPNVIEDSKTKSRVVNFLRFPSITLAEAKIEEDKVVLTVPTIEELNVRINDKTLSLVFGIERSLLNSLNERLVNIPTVKNSLNPIRQAIVEIYEKNSLDINEFKKGRTEKKVYRYLNFLQDLELISIKDKRYAVPGVRFEWIRERLRGKSENYINNILLADVLHKGFDFLRNYLNLTTIVPYLRLATSYYLPSAEKSELLYLNQTSLINKYSDIYNQKINRVTANSQINYLTEVDILKREDNFLYGEENVLKTVQTSMVRSL